MDECGIDAQVIFPNTIGLGGQDLGMVDDHGALPPGHRDLQRRAWPRSRRTRTTASSRCRSCRRGTSTSASREAKRVAALGLPRREHDVRPAGPRRPRPRQPRRGTRSGRCAPTSSCRCTSTSAPASPRMTFYGSYPWAVAPDEHASSPSAARCCSSATRASSSNADPVGDVRPPPRPEDGVGRERRRLDPVHPRDARLRDVGERARRARRS